MPVLRRFLPVRFLAWTKAQDATDAAEAVHLGVHDLRCLLVLIATLSLPGFCTVYPAFGARSVPGLGQARRATCIDVTKHVVELDACNKGGIVENFTCTGDNRL